MATEHKVICDSCGSDITYTTNCVDYRVSLRNVSIPREPGRGSYTLMGVFPSLHENADFCGKVCLIKYLVTTYPEALEWAGIGF